MGTPEVRPRDWTNGMPSLWYGGRVGVTIANQLNLDSLDRKPCAIGGLSRRSRGRIPEPVWQSQRMRRCCRTDARKFLGDPVRDEGSSWTGQGPASRARASSPCPSGPRARCPCHGLPSGADCGSAHGLLLAQAKCQVNRSPSRETRPAEDSAKWVVKTSELVSAAWFIAHQRDFRAASGTDHRSEVIFDHEV